MADNSEFQEVMKRGSVHAWNGRWERAAEEFRLARYLNPEDLSVRTYLAMALYKSGQLLESLELYQELWKAQPSNLATLQRVAELQESLGYPQPAATSYRLLAEIHTRRRSPEGALKAWQKAVALKPEEPLFWDSLMGVAIQVGVVAEVMPGYLNLARELALQGRFEESLRVAERAQALDPANPLVLLLLSAIRRGLSYSLRATQQGEVPSREDLLRVIPPLLLEEDSPLRQQTALPAAVVEQSMPPAPVPENPAAGLSAPAPESLAPERPTGEPPAAAETPGLEPAALEPSPSLSSEPSPSPREEPPLPVEEPVESEREEPGQPEPVGEGAAEEAWIEPWAEKGAAESVEAESPAEEEPSEPVEAESPAEEEPSESVEAEPPPEEEPSEVLEAESPVEAPRPMELEALAEEEVGEAEVTREPDGIPESAEALPVEPAEAAPSETEEVVAESLQEEAPAPSWEELLRQAREARDSGRLEEAVALYEESLAAGTTIAEQVVELAEVYEQLGQGEQAAAAYRQALELSPDLPRAHLAIAGRSLALGRPDLAEEELRLALAGSVAGDETGSRAAELLLDLLAERADAGEWAAAAEGLAWLRSQVTFDRLPAGLAAKVAGVSVELLGLCAGEHLEELATLPVGVQGAVALALKGAEEQLLAGRVRSAADEIAGILVERPNFLPAQSLLGRVLVAQGRREEARERVQRLLYLYRLRGTPGHALEVLWWAVMQGVADGDARVQLVELLRDQNRLEEAEMVELGQWDPPLPQREIPGGSSAEAGSPALWPSGEALVEEVVLAEPGVGLEAVGEAHRLTELEGEEAVGEPLEGPEVLPKIGEAIEVALSGGVESDQDGTLPLEVSVLPDLDGEGRTESPAWQPLLERAEALIASGEQGGAAQLVSGALEAGSLEDEMERVALLRLLLVMGGGRSRREDLLESLRRLGVPEQLAE